MPNASAGNVIADSAQINPGVIQGSDIAAGAIDTTKFGTDAVESADIKDGEIVNTDISPSAAIDDAKLAEINDANKVSGAAFKSLSSIPVGAGVIPAANLPGGADVSCFPLPVVPTDGVSSRALNNPVDGYCALFNLTRGITVNKLTVNVTTVGASGTFKVGIFSENGQTKYGEATSSTVSGGGEVTLTFSNLVLPAGNLWFLFVSVGGANITLSRWGIMATAGGLKDVTSEPSVCGVLTVTSGTIPATMTIASVSASDEGAMVIRLDN